MDHYLINQYEPADFALKLAHKDVSLATEVGREFGVPMRLINATVADMTEDLGRGWADWDSRSAMILQQERAGIEFELDPADVEAVLDSDRS